MPKREANLPEGTRLTNGVKIGRYRISNSRVQCECCNEVMTITNFSRHPKTGKGTPYDRVRIVDTGLSLTEWTNLSTNNPPVFLVQYSDQPDRESWVQPNQLLMSEIQDYFTRGATLVKTEDESPLPPLIESRDPSDDMSEEESDGDIDWGDTSFSVVFTDWTSLPAESIGRIIAFSGYTGWCSLRSVCRKWREMSDQAYYNLCRLMPPARYTQALQKKTHVTSSTESQTDLAMRDRDALCKLKDKN
ncbi:hypothetical protein PROFUN_12843 [Planoprotostelium fungivorum]|uniref:F-box domain-containing protein n=1 Tax=Planoprotostelium fungivorum TaxID=1890364 RepID=A0A2P6N6J9_9EUKA|nr:hypothetical protein PROFUN_12843 [Planoprotostelium fungivorum]